MTSTYKLTYFNLTARAEQIRFLLAYLNVDFEDNRFELEQWPSIKPTMPFGKVPVLEIDGKLVNQSTAICRYLAKKAGLAGNDDWESLLIDVAVDNIYEIRQDIMSNYHDHNEENRSKTRELLVKEKIPFYMDRFEKIVAENGGYFVNGKLSWPDLYFVSTLDHLKFIIGVDLVEGRPNLTALKHKLSWPDLYFVSILDHLKFIIGVDLVEGQPNLTALKHKVLDILQIKSWVARRPKTN